MTKCKVSPGIKKKKLKKYIEILGGTVIMPKNR